MGWILFLLLSLQCTLLGATDALNSGKILFALIYTLFLVWVLKLIVSHGLSNQEPLVFWTVAMLALLAFSRVPGIYWRISLVDWARDLLPLLNFSWILVGAFAFSSRKSFWRGYLVFVAVDLFLTFVVTGHYLVIRQFTSAGSGLFEYVKASDSVVLFGVFMTAPMAGLPDRGHRRWFGLLSATFVTATLLTGTRSHFGALLAGLLFYFWLTKRELKKGARVARRAVLGSFVLGTIAFGAALVSGLVNVQQIIQRIAEMSSLSFGALSYRLDESLLAWDVFQRSPIFGQGLGYQLPSMRLLGSETNLYMLHDFYFYLLVKFGIVGTIIFLAFLVSMIRTAVSTYRQATEPIYRAFAAGLASLIAALVVESLTAARFSDKSATAMLAILIALLLSARRETALSRALERYAAAAPGLRAMRPSSLPPYAPQTDAP